MGILEISIGTVNVEEETDEEVDEVTLTRRQYQLVL